VPERGASDEDLDSNLGSPGAAQLTDSPSSSASSSAPASASSVSLSGTDAVGPEPTVREEDAGDMPNFDTDDEDEEGHRNASADTSQPSSSETGGEEHTAQASATTAATKSKSTAQPANEKQTTLEAQARALQTSRRERQQSDDAQHARDAQRKAARQSLYSNKQALSSAVQSTLDNNVEFQLGARTFVLSFLLLFLFVDHDTPTHVVTISRLCSVFSFAVWSLCPTGPY
jgi:type IV secretory pathway VirB10-like protein